MKVIAIVISLLIIPMVSAKTELSKLVEYVQTTYADSFKDYPILVFDMDEVEYRYAVAKVFGSSKELEKKRQEIIKQYVFEKVGVELSNNEASTYEMYTTILKNGAYAMPTLVDGPNRKKVYKMCAVFPASPNSNQRLETERITGLKTPGAYKDVTFTGLQEKLEYREMQLFSLYHELGHCMDRIYMPQNYNTYEVDAHSVHESESYAEVFALMMLEREGLQGTGRTRALLRNLYTQEMGQWFIDNPQNAFGNQLYLKGGLIYYLAPTLLATDEFVSRNRDFVKGAVDELLLKAGEIVKEYSVDGRSFNAIHRAMNEGHEEMINEYQEWSTRNPSFFTRAYKDLLHFLDYSPYLYEFIVGNTPDINEGSGLEKLGPEEFCSLEKTDFMNYMDLKREELKVEGSSYASQQERQADLNDAFKMWADCL